MEGNDRKSAAKGKKKEANTNNPTKHIQVAGELKRG